MAGVDVWLIRHGHPSMSSAARRRPVLTGSLSLLLGAHLVHHWRWDPITLAGRWIKP